jgi:hypothetical protein
MGALEKVMPAQVLTLLALLVQKYDAGVYSIYLLYLLYLLGAVDVGCRSFLSFVALLVQSKKK